MAGLAFPHPTGLVCRMDSIPAETSPRDADHGEGTPYEAPALTTLGSFQDLTQGGPGGGFDIVEIGSAG